MNSHALSAYHIKQLLFKNILMGRHKFHFEHVVQLLVAVLTLLLFEHSGRYILAACQSVSLHLLDH